MLITSWVRLPSHIGADLCKSLKLEEKWDKEKDAFSFLWSRAQTGER